MRARGSVIGSIVINMTKLDSFASGKPSTRCLLGLPSCSQREGCLLAAPRLAEYGYQMRCSLCVTKTLSFAKIVTR